MNNGFSNGLGDSETEMLAILAEECSEVIKIIGKIFRHGLDSRNPVHDEGTNLEMLQKEMGDVRAAFAMANYFITDSSVVDSNMYQKLLNPQYIHSSYLKSLAQRAAYDHMDGNVPNHITEPT